jgi:hypothetical protein
VCLCARDSWDGGLDGGEAQWKKNGGMRSLAGWGQGEAHRGSLISGRGHTRHGRGIQTLREIAIGRRKGATTWPVKEDSCFTIISVYVQVGSEGYI